MLTGMVPLDTSRSHDAVRKERKLELAGEFTTIYDIRRWEILEEETWGWPLVVSNIVENTIAAYDPKFYLYPISEATEGMPTVHRNRTRDGNIFSLMGKYRAVARRLF